MSSYLLLVLFLIVPLVSSFSWRSCGSDSDLVQVKELNMIQNGKSTFRVSVTGNLTTDIEGPITADFIVEKKFFLTWIFVPCFNDVGSCIFKDVCNFTCPPDVEGDLPCECPVSAGFYNGSMTLDMHSTNVVIPEILESGTFRVKAKVSSPAGQLFCLSYQVRLKHYRTYNI